MYTFSKRMFSLMLDSESVSTTKVSFEDHFSCVLCFDSMKTVFDANTSFMSNLSPAFISDLTTVLASSEKQTISFEPADFIHLRKKLIL